MSEAGLFGEPSPWVEVLPSMLIESTPCAPFSSLLFLGLSGSWTEESYGSEAIPTYYEGHHVVGDLAHANDDK